MPDPRALRVMSLDSPDFDSAARIAAARERVVRAPSGASSPTPITTPAQSGPASATGTDPAAGTRTPPQAPSGGPDQPPNPASPNFLDQS